MIENGGILSSFSPLVPWYIERGPASGVPLWAEGENKVLGMFPAGSRHIVPFSSSFYTSLLSALSPFF